jgi:hypothetical protein
MSTAMGAASMKRMLSENLFEMRADTAADTATLTATLQQGGAACQGQAKVPSPHHIHPP